MRLDPQVAELEVALIEERASHARTAQRLLDANRRRANAIATTRKVFQDFDRVREALDYIEEHEAAAARDAARKEQGR